MSYVRTAVLSFSFCLLLWSTFAAVLDTDGAVTAENCSIAWDPSDWTVRGHCDVTLPDISGEKYECHWWHEDRSNQYLSSEVLVLGNSSSARCQFHGYGMASGSSGNFRLWIHMGNTWTNVTSIPIERPGGYPDVTSCPSHVEEGSSLACLCQLSSIPGVPRPLLTWRKGHQVNPLVLENVSLDLNGSVYSCWQYWGGWHRVPRTVSYTVSVIYDVLDEKDEDPSGMIISIVVVVVIITLGILFIIFIVLTVIVKKRKRIIDIEQESCQNIRTSQVMTSDPSAPPPESHILHHDDVTQGDDDVMEDDARADVIDVVESDQVTDGACGNQGQAPWSVTDDGYIRMDQNKAVTQPEHCELYADVRKLRPKSPPSVELTSSDLVQCDFSHYI